jgi:nicotinamide mononucleotide transporter
MSTIWEAIQQCTLLDWVAFSTGILQVVLAARNHVANFYAAIISVSIYAYQSIHVGLFAEASLNIFYFIMAIWGIIIWGKTFENKPIAKSNKRDIIISAGICMTTFLLCYALITNYTTSNVPLADSIVAALAYAGTYLMSKRKVENWLVLNLSNAIAIPLQWQKGMPLYAILTAILFVIAIFGYVKWRKWVLESIDS